MTVLSTATRRRLRSRRRLGSVPSVGGVLSPLPLLPWLLSLPTAVVVLLPVAVRALNNGFVVPPMGWSTWYGNLGNIDEALIKETADALVTTGLRDLGYRYVWIDDGFAVGRERLSRKLAVDSKLFPSGMRALSEYVHERGLKLGVYTSKGEMTCLGYSKRGPDRPGSCGYEDVDADTYANDWRIDALKNDGCGNCKYSSESGNEGKDPFVVMRDALNKTGRPIYYAVHGSNRYGEPLDEVANDWRTGIDLCCPWYDLWLHLLEKATTEEMRAKVGPGSFANPDFLQVGWSRSKSRDREGPDFPMMSLLERRSHYTMWAALPAPLVLGAELRPGKQWGGIDDPYTMETLTNPEVIAINQDTLAAPMRAVVNDTKVEGVQVWMKPLAAVGGDSSREAAAGEAGGAESFAVVLFHRTTIDVSAKPEGNYHTPRSDPPSTKRISVNWERLGQPDCAAFEVRDLWARETLGTYCGRFEADVEEREARIYRFTCVNGLTAVATKHGNVGHGGDGNYVEVGRCGCAEDSRALANEARWAHNLRGSWLIAFFAAGLALSAKLVVFGGTGGRRKGLGVGYLPVRTEEEGRRE